MEDILRRVRRLALRKALSRRFPIRGHTAWRAAIRRSRAFALFKAVKRREKHIGPYRPRGPHAVLGPATGDWQELTPELRASLMERRPERVIPPSVTHVRLPRDPESPLVAVFSDKSGKNQYVYTAAHRHASRSAGLEALEHVGRVLPRVRQWANAQLERAVRQPTTHMHTHETGIAAIITLMDHTGMRVGERRMAIKGGAHGAASLRPEHVTVSDDTVSIATKGKGGRATEHSVHHPALARVVQAHAAIPAHMRAETGFLFHAKTPEGKYKHTTADHVRKFLADEFGIHPHAIRRFHANRVMREALEQYGTPRTAEEAEQHIKAAYAQVAKFLGDTPQMTRHYVDDVHADAHRQKVGGGRDLFSSAAAERMQAASPARRQMAGAPAPAPQEPKEPRTQPVPEKAPAQPAPGPAKPVARKPRRRRGGRGTPPGGGYTGRLFDI